MPILEACVAKQVNGLTRRAQARGDTFGYQRHRACNLWVSSAFKIDGGQFDSLHKRSAVWKCVVSTLHHLPVHATTPYSSQLSPLKVSEHPDHPLLRRIQTAAAGSRCPPQAPPEAANFSRRASLAVSERKLMIQSSTRRRKRTPFFSAL